MAEVLAAYAVPVRDHRESFRARSIGRRADDGMWEGWLEFVRVGASSHVQVGSVESRQAERGHLLYWARGLTLVYLEGALGRARTRLILPSTASAARPASNAPAPRPGVLPHSALPHAVLDPFKAGARNLRVLEQQLRALNRPRLLNIVAAHGLNGAGENLMWMSDAQLAHFIVIAVETQLRQRLFCGCARSR